MTVQEGCDCAGFVPNRAWQHLVCLRHAWCHLRPTHLSGTRHTRGSTSWQAKGAFRKGRGHNASPLKLSQGLWVVSREWLRNLTLCLTKFTDKQQLGGGGANSFLESSQFCPVYWCSPSGASLFVCHGALEDIA